MDYRVLASLGGNFAPLLDAWIVLRLHRATGVARNGHPGLARSTDCEAQWIHGGPRKVLSF